MTSALALCHIYRPSKSLEDVIINQKLVCTSEKIMVGNYIGWLGKKTTKILLKLCYEALIKDPEQCKDHLYWTWEHTSKHQLSENSQ